MQEDNGRRALFVKGEQSITPGQVVNQVIRTGQAEVAQIGRKAQQEIQDIKDIIGSVESGYKSLQTISNVSNERALLSAQTALDRQKIEYTNLVAPGGIIDNENISYEEKNVKKQQAYNDLQTSIQQSKELLQSKRGIFQQILGTEASYNNALANFDNKSQEILNDAQRQINAQRKELDVRLSLENTSAIISSITNANDVTQIDNIRETAVQSIIALEQKGYITPADREKSLNDLSRNINNRKVDVDINYAKYLMSVGASNEAYSFLGRQYQLAREGKAYNEYYGGNKELIQSSRVENETKLLNAFNSLQKMQGQQTANNLLSNYNIDKSASQNLIDIRNSNEYKALDDTQKKFVEENISKQANKYEKDPLSWFVENNPNATYEQRQEWLNAKGYGSKTALMPAEASIMKNSFANFGTNVNREITLDAEFDNLIADTKQIIQNDDGLIKEAKANLNGLEMLAVETYLTKGKADALPLINLLSTANKNNGKLPILLTEDQIVEQSKNYYNTERGQYEFRRNPAVANKQGKAYAEIANYTKTTINDNVDRYNDTTITYYNTATKSIKFDNTRYDFVDIDDGINAILQEPDKFFDLSELDYIEKIDLRGEIGNGNLKAWSNDSDEIIFSIKSKGGSISDVPLRRVPIDDVIVFGKGGVKNLSGIPKVNLFGGNKVK